MSELRVLHHDDDIIVINKEPNLLSVPGRYEPDCAQARVAQEFGNALVIHRLDKDTSGILVFAHHKAALTHIQQQFEKQTTQKTYEAVVYGRPPTRKGCINMPIIVDWPNRPLQKISHSEGRYALTRWHIMEEMTDRTRVALFPKTGRSHQLRLHMQQLGCAIVGDPLYAPELAASEARMQLHARHLEFNHPSSNERLVFHCPPDF